MPRAMESIKKVLHFFDLTASANVDVSLIFLGLRTVMFPVSRDVVDGFMCSVGLFAKSHCSIYAYPWAGLQNGLMSIVGSV